MDSPMDILLGLAELFGGRLMMASTQFKFLCLHISLMVITMSVIMSTHYLQCTCQIYLCRQLCYMIQNFGVD